MKRSAFKCPATSGAWLAGLALLLMLAAGIAHAQPQRRTLGAENADPPEESSEKVEDSDESYRQRMELRDGFPGQQTRIETTYSKPASNAKIDQLPVPSQKHIKDQMREMIIESGQWEPGQDLSDYPYEPSTAAQTDAKLRGGEREAWSEELQKYQEREAAAYAQTTGQSESDARTEGTPGQPGQPGGQTGKKGDERGAAGSPGGNPGTGPSGNSLAERNARALQAAAAYQGSSATGEEAVSTAGASENALSYVQALNGGTAGANPDGSQQQASGQAGEQAGQTGSNQQSGQGADGQSAQMTRQGSGNQSGEPTEESTQGQMPTEDLAGTMAIGDLQNMFAESSQGSSSGANSSASANPDSSPNSGASSSAASSANAGTNLSASSSASLSMSSSSESAAEASADAGQGSSAASGQQGIAYRDVKPLVEVEPGTLTLEELRSLDGSAPEK